MFKNRNQLVKVLLFYLILNSELAQANLQVRRWSRDFVPPMNKVVQSLKENRIDGLNIILWYFGPNGLRQGGVDFYKQELFNPTIELNLTYFLYDLTAWGIFSQPSWANLKLSSSAKELAERKLSRYSVLFSSEFFE